MSSTNNIPSTANTTTTQTDAPKVINLKVANAEGCEVFFKIKYHTPLKKLIDAYCKKQGINPLTVRFSYDGELISGDKTAEQMGMEDQDVIDCHQQQTGGFSFN